MTLNSVVFKVPNNPETVFFILISITIKYRQLVARRGLIRNTLDSEVTEVY